MRGTHQGEFLGIPPTGKQVTVGLVDVIHIENGKFVEQWGGPDLLDLVQQLGGEISVKQ
jgi:predicted ester cyclase